MIYADQPIPGEGKHRTLKITTHQEDKQNKATSPYFAIKMVAKRRHKVQNNKTKAKHTNVEPVQIMGPLINNEQHQHSHRLRIESSLSHRGLLKCLF